MVGKRGSGKNTLAVHASKQKVKCISCDKTFGKNKIKELHYDKVVILVNDKPMNPESVNFDKLEENLKEYTRFFFNNNLIPSTKVYIPISNSLAETNPWT